MVNTTNHYTEGLPIYNRVEEAICGSGCTMDGHAAHTGTGSNAWGEQVTAPPQMQPEYDPFDTVQISKAKKSENVDSYRLKSKASYTYGKDAASDSTSSIPSTSHAEEQEDRSASFQSRLSDYFARARIERADSEKHFAVSRGKEKAQPRKTSKPSKSSNTTTSLALREAKEAAYLFPSSAAFNLGTKRYTVYEEYFLNYWKYFHPSFPILHRAILDAHNNGSTISPLLRASMIAVGAQYSDVTGRRKSRRLHRRCLALLDKRDLQLTAESERLCDDQAIFLLEVISQYRAPNATIALSSRFQRLCHRLEDKYLRLAPSTPYNFVSTDDDVLRSWKKWILQESGRRLLQCCYILDAYRPVHFACAPPQHACVAISGQNLPFPVHSSLWDTTSISDWAVKARAHTHVPESIRDLTLERHEPFDEFQSLMLITIHYNYRKSLESSSANGGQWREPQSIKIESQFCSSARTRHQLLTAKLLRYIPLRQLFVFCETAQKSSEKGKQSNDSLRKAMAAQSWVEDLWMPFMRSRKANIENAVEAAYNLIANATSSSDDDFRIEFGGEMGLYLAVMVLALAMSAALAHVHSICPTHCSSHTSNSSADSKPEMGLASSRSPMTSNHLVGSLRQSSECRFGFAASSASASLELRAVIDAEIDSPLIDNIERVIKKFGLAQLGQQWPFNMTTWRRSIIAKMQSIKKKLEGSQASTEELGEYLTHMIRVLGERIQVAAEVPIPIKWTMNQPGQPSSDRRDEDLHTEGSSDSDRWTDDLSSDVETPQLPDELQFAIRKAADFLLAQYDEWHHSRSGHFVVAQADTSGSCSGSASRSNAAAKSHSDVSSGNNPRNKLNPRKRAPGDGDEDSRRPSQRRKIGDPCAGSSAPLLACPFAKHNPLYHRKCFKYVLQDIARVKQHLLRVHRIPVHCARCSQEFANEDERDSHLREQPQCPVEPQRVWDGITESQKRLLAKRVSCKKSKEDNWFSIFETLFPSSPLPDSPYIENTHLSEELLALREFTSSEAPARIARFAEAELQPHLRFVQDDIEAFTQAAVRDVFDMVLERWSPILSSDLGGSEDRSSHSARSNRSNHSTNDPVNDLASGSTLCAQNQNDESFLASLFRSELFPHTDPMPALHEPNMIQNIEFDSGPPQLDDLGRIMAPFEFNSLDLLEHVLPSEVGINSSECGS